MKFVLSLFIILASIHAWSGEEPSNDFSQSTSELKPLSREEMSYRFHVQGEIFILSTDGEKLINLANENREWQFGGPSAKPLESNWRFQQKGLPLVALKQKWTLEQDGKVSLEVTQFEDIERRKGEVEVKFGKVIKQEKFVIKDFAPVDWTIPGNGLKLVVRLTPAIWANQEAMDISALPISGKNILVYGRSGKVWADQVNPNGPSTYLGITTHLGSVFFSFIPFKGAKVIGEGKDGRIKISNGKINIVLQSETPFLPRNIKAKVYGIVKTELKTTDLYKVNTYSSSGEEEFLKRIQSDK